MHIRIGVLSDIHGNSIALKHALDSIENDVESIICLGDLCGYLPMINEVIHLLIQYDVTCIKGNHDNNLLNGYHGQNALIAEAIQINRRNISQQNLQFLEQLPMTNNIIVNGLSISLMHGGPNDYLEEYIYPNDAASRQSFEPIDSDFIFVGHTHIPMNLKLNGQSIVNPGSIGLPRNCDPRPTYAILDTNNSSIEFHSFMYDLDKVIDTLDSYNYQKSSSDILASSLFNGCGKFPLTPMYHQSNSSIFQSINNEFSTTFRTKIYKKVMYIFDHNDKMLIMISIDKDNNTFFIRSGIIDTELISENPKIVEQFSCEKYQFLNRFDKTVIYKQKMYTGFESIIDEMKFIITSLTNILGGDIHSKKY